MNRIKALIIVSLLTTSLFGQSKETDTLSKKQIPKFNYKSLIIPTALIGYGVIGLENKGIKNFNLDVKKELNGHVNEEFSVGDMVQYTPALSVYGLNALGIKGKHNLKDRTIILGTAFIIMGTTVFGMKKLTQVNRPDDSNITSFPSGHTATAFMGAEFLYQEYKDVSIWYGVSGYLVASGVAYLRIYNNRHWFTDVVAGAGFGIISTKVAYWMYPFMKRTFFKDKKDRDGIVMPFYNGKEYGIGFSMSF